MSSITIRIMLQTIVSNMLVLMALIVSWSGVSSAQELSYPDLGAYSQQLEELEPEADESEEEEDEIEEEEGQSESELLGAELGRQFLYDARTIGVDKDGKTYVFKGDVVLIGAGNLITADLIKVQYDQKVLTAHGHVILLTADQVFTGDEIKVWWESGDFEIKNAVMIVNDAKKVTEVSREILGLTVAELEFRQDKVKRLEEINRKKKELRLKFQKSAEQGQAPSLTAETVDQYALLLEQEKLLENASVPSLSSKGEEGRKRYLKRRRYWEEAQRPKVSPKLRKDYHFQLSGRFIERKNNNDYVAKDAAWTPCMCEEDEEPAWGFRADTIHAQEEGYIDLYHPVLFIKGVPILYIPFLKVPFKTKRQSGFLMPGFQTGDQKNGFVYTQPVYFALAPNYDATVTTDIFQKRGTRLGLEVRYEAREYSGFRLNLETIRDRAWLERRSDREDLLQHYLEIADYCGAEDNLDEACVNSVRENLSIPSNTWRGKQEWQGRYFLTPRWSLVSRGTLVSDHRYVEDLYLPEDYVAAFSTRAEANAFTTAKARLSYNGTSHFFGLGTYYGDNVLMNDQFKGQQIPLAAKFMTRNYLLDPKRWLPAPVYGSFSAESYFIRELSGNFNPTKDDMVSLGSGQWQRAAVNVISPIVSEGIVRVDYFADAEARRILHAGLDEPQSLIHSWRSGITLNLPIDGMGTLPSFMQTEGFDGDPLSGTRYLHHIMNWALTYSARPVVVRRGPYASEKDPNGASLVYFATDRDFLTAVDTRDVSNEETMIPHQRLTFSTQHRWKSFMRSWSVQYGTQKKLDDRKERIIDLHEQAKRELLFSLDRRVNDSNQILTENTSSVDWHINRYRLIDADSIEPINFNASITFDFEQERLRKQQIEKNQELERVAGQALPEQAEEINKEIVPYANLPEAWIGPYFSLGINWGGYNLSSQLVYNVYKKASTSTIFDLQLPPFYSTKLGFRYVFEKSPELAPGTNDIIFRRTRTQSLSLSTGLIPRVSTGISLVHKLTEGAPKSQYGTSVNVAYTDPSGCWGVRFVREKDLNQNEENANYVLQLTVIFLGNQRSGDISPTLEREIPRFTFAN